MKLAVVYNPNDHKLSPQAYSWTYRDQLLAILRAFAPVQEVTESIDAKDIDADVILFYDPHSNHHIDLPGIKQHPALKVEYFNDPHQDGQTYKNRERKTITKLGPGERVIRARDRGVTHIICPYRSGYEKYISPFAYDMELIHLPVAPAARIANPMPLAQRHPQVLCNGHLWEGVVDGFRPYEFRRWAAEQSCVTSIAHAVDGGAVSGPWYQTYLEQYAGALALCDTYVVPKYIEIPLAGCVCFCQMLPEYAEMGFVDGVNCIAVDRDTLTDRIEAFRKDPTSYQDLADAGRELALTFSAEAFARRLKGVIEQVTAVPT